MAHDKFFVYAVLDGETVLYVGKGSGRRDKVSARQRGGESKVLETFSSEDEALVAEARWIDELLPVQNKTKGGNGNRVKQGAIPQQWRGRISLGEWKECVKEAARFEKKIDELGSQCVAAIFLLSKLNAANCEGYGVSKLDLVRLQEVAHG